METSFGLSAENVLARSAHINSAHIQDFSWGETSMGHTTRYDAARKKDPSARRDWPLGVAKPRVMFE
jgi:hypothetical protein